jgi:protein AbiQ
MGIFNARFTSTVKRGTLMQRGYESYQNRINRGYESYQNRINRGYESYQNRINKMGEKLILFWRNNMLVNWKIINEDYLNYLRNNYEPRIPFSDYGLNKFKPFFGSLFDVDNSITYVTQISHPQERHKALKQNIDFYKIYHPTDGRFIAVINLNYMFPIHKSLFTDLQYGDIEKYRIFNNLEEKSKYIDLLKIELVKINQLPVVKNALKIYELKYKYPENIITRRCFDFKKLEKICMEYITMQEVAASKENV